MPGKGDNKVLVLDDDRDLLSLVAFVLEEDGYEVKTATDGREGLDAVQREMPDLILLDMKMPVMDGWEFAREFHSKFDSKVPIVVLTAAADARRSAEEVGAVGWIGKPFDLDTLTNTVKRNIQKN